MSVLIFILATVFIVFFGSFDSLRPAFVIDGETVRLGMSAIIEIVMLSAAALILLLTRTDGMKVTQGSVFPAGMQAVIAIFGIAWMGDTFLQGNMLQLKVCAEPLVHASRTCFDWRCHRAGVAFHQDILRETAAFNPLYIGLCLFVYRGVFPFTHCLISA